jgi:hypothetical protein
LCAFRSCITTDKEVVNVFVRFSCATSIDVIEEGKFEIG